ANMLAGVLVTCCFVLLGLEVLVRGEERYARVGSGAARYQQRIGLGRATIPSLALLLVTTLLALGVPFITIGRWLLAGGADVWRLDEIGLALGQ
ncbi:iron ABC transporter permease, partial [Mesorhizobium sp. M2D.F.Ca.ET.145.01.1.1]